MSQGAGGIRTACQGESDVLQRFRWQTPHLLYFSITIPSLGGLRPISDKHAMKRSRTNSPRVLKGRHRERQQQPLDRGGTDIFTRAKRSQVMSLVRSKDTVPELKVRSALHTLGFRFRLHRKDLPGCPDIVFPMYHTVVFVHGCFWHQHKGCRKAKLPKQNASFWAAKLRRNAQRDVEVQKQLKALGWRVVVVWECELGK